VWLCQHGFGEDVSLLIFTVSFPSALHNGDKKEGGGLPLSMDYAADSGLFSIWIQSLWLIPIPAFDSGIYRCSAGKHTKTSHLL